MKKLIKKLHFKFVSEQGTNMGRLHLRAKFANVVLTLTDLDNKVIICKTAGSSGVIGTKRQKRVPQVIEPMVKHLLPYIKLYKINNFQIVMKMKIRGHFYVLVKELEFHNLNITGVIMRRRIAFNGVRGRKLRRT